MNNGVATMYALAVLAGCLVIALYTAAALVDLAIAFGDMLLGLMDWVRQEML